MYRWGCVSMQQNYLVCKHYVLIKIEYGIYLQRQSITQPTKPCISSNEGESLYKALHVDMIWICKSKQWTPYK